MSYSRSCQKTLIYKKIIKTSAKDSRPSKSSSLASLVSPTLNSSTKISLNWELNGLQKASFPMGFPT